MVQKAEQLSTHDTTPAKTRPLSSQEGGKTARQAADWQATVKQPVFVIEDSFFRSRIPSPVHWSIAWSDMMMTMFILFLCLFVYQLAHREFLDQEQVEVVGGTTIPLPPQIEERGITPFHPISPQLSQRPGPKLKAVERKEEKDVLADDTLKNKEIPVKATQQSKGLQPPKPVYQIIPENLVFEDKLPPKEEASLSANPSRNQAITPKKKEIIAKIYDLSKTTLEEEKLERFASIELIPDKAMRIILTGDLLFASGEAILTRQAKQSLRKLSAIIAQTPYMINVVGHTDSVPMSSMQFPSNWELSVARASTVARFLIEEIKVPGNQIVVSGFSYFRPLRPNNTEQNRSINRRVEIILSKEMPPTGRSTQ